MRRETLVLLVINLVLSVTALGWLAWITLEPRHWFADAYAAKGPTGDAGPRGSIGPQGPAGPVGPDAADAIDELDFRVSDLEAGLVAGVDVADLEGRVEGLELIDPDTRITDLEDTVSSMCDEMSFSSITAIQDIYFSAC